MPNWTPAQKKKIEKIAYDLYLLRKRTGHRGNELTDWLDAETRYIQYEAYYQ